MHLFTIGFTQKSAETFFNLVTRNEIEILIDIRLNNQSQLAGFTKGRDLEYFLKKICGCAYSHETLFAPTKDLLERYKKQLISWSDYEIEYNDLMRRRNAVEIFRDKYMKYENLLLLCSEPTPECCHRRLLGEMLCQQFKCDLTHI